MLFKKSEEKIIKQFTTKEGHRAVIKESINHLLLVQKKYYVTIYLKGFKDRILCGWSSLDKNTALQDAQNWKHKEELANYIYPVLLREPSKS